jgi:hypothetical protein
MAAVYDDNLLRGMENIELNVLVTVVCIQDGEKPPSKLNVSFSTL